MSNTTITPSAGASAFAGIAPVVLLTAIPLIIPIEQGAAWLVEWTAMTAPMVGAPAPRKYGTASMQAEGVFGSGGSVQLEGSNDQLNFHKLSPSALTQAGLVSPLAADGTPWALRPNVTAGDSTTLINCTLWLRG
jgi:hypothetical protein